ncbi:MAG: hypothetical protein ACXWE3_13630 [Methylobacter sp.]
MMWTRKTIWHLTKPDRSQTSVLKAMLISRLGDGKTIGEIIS